VAARVPKLSRKAVRNGVFMAVGDFGRRIRIFSGGYSASAVEVDYIGYITTSLLVHL
jgi:hypothetical protein